MHQPTDHTGKGLLQLAEEFTAEAARLAAVNRMTDAEVPDTVELLRALAADVADTRRAVLDLKHGRTRTLKGGARFAEASAEQRARAAGNPRNDATGGQDARGGRELLARLGQGDYEREVWG
jgi:hypothetical protein